MTVVSSTFNILQASSTSFKTVSNPSGTLDFVLTVLATGTDAFFRPNNYVEIKLFRDGTVAADTAIGATLFAGLDFCYSR